MEMSEKRKQDAVRNHLPSDRQLSPTEKKTPSAFAAFFRTFTYATSSHYVLLGISIVAAITAGVAQTMVNVVMDEFVRLLGSVGTEGFSDSYMSAVSTTAYVEYNSSSKIQVRMLTVEPSVFTSFISALSDWLPSICMAP